MIRSILIALLILNLGCRSRKAEEPGGKSISVQVIHGPELRAFLSSAKERFYLTEPKLSDGSAVKIELANHMAESAAKGLANGEIKAESWVSPLPTLVQYTNSNVKNLGAHFGGCRDIARSPIVIAGASGSLDSFVGEDGKIPLRSVLESGIARINDDTESNQIAVSYGRPRQSVTGLGALLELAYVAQDNRDKSLTTEMIKEPSALTRLQSYQSLVSGYDLSESLLLSNAIRPSDRRKRFVITSAQQVNLFNRDAGGDKKAVSTYEASEGTVELQYQFCVSDTDLLTPAQRAGAEQFGDFLASEAGREEAVHQGFDLPNDTNQTPNVVPTGTPNKKIILPSAEGSAAFYLLENWTELMRPSAVVLVLDSSGSMDGEPLRAAREQFRNLLAKSQSRDVRAIVSFSSKPVVESPFSSDLQNLMGALDKIQSSGGSAVYDGIRSAVELISDNSLRPYRKMILIITDGDDKNSNISLDALIPFVDQKVETLDMALVIIGVDSPGIDYSDLERLTKTVHGKFLRSTPEQFSTVLTDVWKVL